MNKVGLVYFGNTMLKVPSALSISEKKRSRSILLPSTFRLSLSRVSLTPVVPAIILIKMALVKDRLAALECDDVLTLKRAALGSDTVLASIAGRTVCHRTPKTAG